RRVVLHGGTDWMGFAQNHLVWEYDGVDWQAVGSGGPGARRDAAMAFWPASGRTWLFGGIGAGGPWSDVWTWDGAVWSPVAVVGAEPAGRFDARLALDAARGVLVLHGGTDVNALSHDDTWDFDGVVWTPWNLPAERRPRGPRNEFGMAWSPRHERVVVHAGFTSFTAPLDDTWLLGAAAEPFGSSCGGETLAASLRPRLGQSTTLRVEALAPGVTAAAIAFGVSDVTSVFGALPFALAPLGGAGCALLVSTDAIAPMVRQNGIAAYALALPATPVLLGTTMFAQALLLDPAANSLGARTTNALELVLGR
ncbi:MAG: hypothetical protein KDE27_28195, partial [Planctomycetes bacterium]|nr:hypothetical protein [Planctomycetota bacterium]